MRHEGSHKLYVAHFVDDFLVMFHPSDKERLFEPFRTAYEDEDPEDYLGGEVDIADNGEFV